MYTELSKSINNLYEVFRNVPRPSTIDACPCCVDKKQICTLLKKKLPDITPDEMSGYAASVFLTVGSDSDFRYFIPRILDILINEPFWWPDPEIVGRALGTYGWNNFTKDEQTALSNYFDSVLIGNVTSSEPDGSLIDSWLCAASNFYPSWEKYLEIIINNPKALIAVFECHSKTLSRNRLNDGFWYDSPNKQVFINWLNSETTKLTIMNAYGL